MEHFKVGDKVILIINFDSNLKIGEIGTVVRVLDGCSYPLIVCFSSRVNIPLAFNEVVHYTLTTKLIYG